MVPIGIVALVIIVIVLATMSGKGSGTRRCRWQRDQRRAREAAMDRWICSRCGVDAFTSGGRPLNYASATSETRHSKIPPNALGRLGSVEIQDSLSG